MKHIISLLAIATALYSHAAKRMPQQLDTNAIRRIAAMLPAKPRSICDPITKRDRWDQLRDHEAFESVIPNAETKLAVAIKCGRVLQRSSPLLKARIIYDSEYTA